MTEKRKLEIFKQIAENPWKIELLEAKEQTEEILRLALEKEKNTIVCVHPENMDIARKIYEKINLS